MSAANGREPTKLDLMDFKISVIIPAYNAEKFVLHALESVVCQSLVPHEIIIIDDGSKDHTSDVVGEWQNKNLAPCQVRLIRHENVGVTGTRNKGIGLASGNWIAFLDADDVWLRNHLQVLADAIQTSPAAVASYGAGRLFSENRLWEKLYDEFWDRPSVKLGRRIEGSEFLLLTRDILPRLMKGNFIKPSSLLVSKSAIDRVGNFDERLRSGEDREFLIRLIIDGDFVYSPVEITRYRNHDDNLTHDKNARVNLENGLKTLDYLLKNPKLRLARCEVSYANQQMRSVGAEFLYLCAKEGLREYLRGLRILSTLLGTRQWLFALNGRHAIRALRAI